MRESYRRSLDGSGKILSAQPAGASGGGDHELAEWLNGEIAEAKAAMEWIGRLRRMTDELNAIPGVTARITIYISGGED